jgi:hypothetical protein
MQAVGTKNRTSLHYIDGSAFKTRGSLSIGRGGHVRKRRRGSLSFGISIVTKRAIISIDGKRNEGIQIIREKKIAPIQILILIFVLPSLDGDI